MSARAIIEGDTYLSLLQHLRQDYDSRVGREVPRSYFIKAAARLGALRGLSPAQNRHVQRIIDYAPEAAYDPSMYRELLGRT
jgi:hypothetical protein